MRRSRIRLATIGAALALASGAASGAPATVEGRVLDASTRAGVPFASVGIRSLGIGTVAGPDGRYSLSIPAGGSVVTFSATGYEARDVPSGVLAGSADVTLDAIPYAVRETVVVSAGIEGDERSAVTLGRSLEPRGHSIGFGSGQLGAQVGARIAVRRPTLLATANFVVSHTRGDRFLYRVHIYDFADGRVGADLLPRDVLVEGRKERGTMTVDLSVFRLVVDRDVLLALEWVRDDERREGVPPLMFRARRGGSGDLYHRLSSQGAFARIDGFRPGFFLTGYVVGGRSSGR